MAYLDDAPKVWTGLFQRQELDAALAPLRAMHLAKRGDIEKMLRKPLTPAEWPTMQFLQGEIEALAVAIRTLHGLATKPEATQLPAAARRPDDELLGL